MGSRFYAHDSGMTTFFHPKDAVSALNAVFGFAAIALVYQGSIATAAVAMLAAVVADAADGYVARTFFEPTEFGKRMDIADLISFGVAPAFFLLVVAGESLVTYVAAFALVVGALLRLARFQTGPDTDGFAGVPITVNGVLFPALFFAGASGTVLVGTAFVMAVLMVSAFKLPKGLAG